MKAGLDKATPERKVCIENTYFLIRFRITVAIADSKIMSIAYYSFYVRLCIRYLRAYVIRSFGISK